MCLSNNNLKKIEQHEFYFNVLPRGANICFLQYCNICSNIKMFYFFAVEYENKNYFFYKFISSRSVQSMKKVGVFFSSSGHVNNSRIVSDMSWNSINYSHEIRLFYIIIKI